MIGPHLLGRTKPKDQKHLAYEVSWATPPQGIEVELKRPTLSDYDQGQAPECVAYSTSRVMNWFNRYSFDAAWLYARCKEVDGDPTGDGTNARAACDVLRTLGHWRTVNGTPVKAGPKTYHGIASNHWATNVDAIRACFTGKPQPVLIGIDWHQAWFQPFEKDAEHWLQSPLIGNAGAVVGGHEIGIWACSDKRQAFGLANTWGTSWPELVWMPYTTMTYLFAAGADACIVTDLATR